LIRREIKELKHQDRARRLIQKVDLDHETPCDKCNAKMIWATLANKYICIECGFVKTIEMIIQVKDSVLQ